ncbi:MAG: SMC-Scp complex subunit ScpB [Candidatus Omnitrophica bacterium]|nr:SMC-Scp complex subunit ScpB [Candidatus Omnitrophota bacterium]
MQNYDSEQIDMLKGIIESLLFVSEKPVTIDQIKKVLETVSPSEIKDIINLLNNDYEKKQGGVGIVEIAGGYQMLSNPKYVSYLRAFFKTKHKEKLSKPALETLAIIAYKQPVTRSEIEIIRGVDSDGVVAHLVEKELIKISGRKDVPGRPFVFGTTKLFLEYFGLRALEDLPKLEEFPDFVSRQEANIIQPEEEIKTNGQALTEEVAEQLPIEAATEAAGDLMLQGEKAVQKEGNKEWTDNEIS